MILALLCSLHAAEVGPRSQSYPSRHQGIPPIIGHLSTVTPETAFVPDHTVLDSATLMPHRLLHRSWEKLNPCLGTQSLWYHRAISSEILSCTLDAIREQDSWAHRPSTEPPIQQNLSLTWEMALLSNLTLFNRLRFGETKSHFLQIRKRKLLARMEKRQQRDAGRSHIC